MIRSLPNLVVSVFSIVSTFNNIVYLTLIGNLMIHMAYTDTYDHHIIYKQKKTRYSLLYRIENDFALSPDAANVNIAIFTQLETRVERWVLATS